jgi:hypothetical protein
MWEAIKPCFALGPVYATLSFVTHLRAQDMAGQSVIAAGTALATGLPWLKRATVTLWRRLPGWATRAATWAWEAVVAIAYLVFLICISVMGLYAAYILGLFAWQVFR